MKKPHDLADRKDLENELKKILVEWPLYRKFHYTMRKDGSFQVLPDTIRRYCSTDKHALTWHRTGGSNDPPGLLL